MKALNIMICAMVIIFSATASAVQKCEKINNNYVFTDSVTALYTVTTNKDNRLHQSERRTMGKEDNVDSINVEEPRCYDVVGFLTTLLFDFDSVVLKPNEKKKLNELAVRNNLPDTLVLVGHTDDEGSNAYNNELGLRRAEVVAQYVMDQGINNINLVTRSEGKFKPRCVGEGKVVGECNRRVEVFYEGRQ